MKHTIRFLTFHTLLVLAIGCSADRAGDTTGFDPWTADEKASLLSELDRSQDAVVDACRLLTADQWQFRESPDRWSIIEIVEHLQLQDLMFWRELYVLMQFPAMHYYHGLHKAPDSVFVSYATVTGANTSRAPWYIRPHGRWQTIEQALEIYRETRARIRELVETSEVDFRQYITPRGWRDQAELRDLHQLVLLLVAHTDRHHGQIERVKAHPDWPE
ncbi:MAG: DinB family protein [Saprospiraceae bacterium]|nr:DinB family protein [Saprospiraceae bacterium]